MSEQPIESPIARDRRKRELLIAIRRHVWRETDLGLIQKARASLAFRFNADAAEDLLDYCDGVCAAKGNPTELIGFSWEEFLQWLWENREEILEFILMLIDLFS